MMHDTLDAFLADFQSVAAKLEPWQKHVMTRFICSFSERMNHKYFTMTEKERLLWSHEVMANNYPAPSWYDDGRHNTYQYSNFLGFEDGVDQIVRSLCYDAPNCDVMLQAYNLFYSYVFGSNHFNLSHKDLIEACAKLCRIIGH